MYYRFLLSLQIFRMKNCDYSAGKTLATSTEDPAELHLVRKQFSDNTNAQLTLAFTLPQDELIDLFEEVATSCNFQMIEREAHYATAIKKGKKASFWEFMNCLGWLAPKSNLSVVKLNVFQNHKKLDSSIKVCRVRSLSAQTTDAQQFIDSFKHTLEALQGVSPSSAMVLEMSNFKEDLPQENNANPFHMEACAHYILHKILSSHSPSEKTIASKLSKALEDFHEAFKNVKESSSSLPTPMNNVIGIAKETYEDIKEVMMANKDGENHETLLPFLKIAVEKYVFDKTEKLLCSIYQEANRELTVSFDHKRKHILDNMTCEDIFQEVLLSKRLRITKNVKTKPSARSIEFCGKACPELEQISCTSSPREKIKNCQLMYAELKGFFFEALNKKYELSSMQDIIPVFIVVVLLTNVSHIRCELDMMGHFIQGAGEDFQAEKRLVINLSESFNYIVRDWKILALE